MVSTLVETININAGDFTDNFLTCPTCIGPYDEDEHAPKLLPCSHTLCRACLERIALTAIPVIINNSSTSTTTTTTTTTTSAAISNNNNINGNLNNNRNSVSINLNDQSLINNGSASSSGSNLVTLHSQRSLARTVAAADAAAAAFNSSTRQLM
jgi:hypothetical protein